MKLDFRFPSLLYSSKADKMTVTNSMWFKAMHILINLDSAIVDEDEPINHTSEDDKMNVKIGCSPSQRSIQ